MDALISASARALAAGDPLAALQRVALRNDPPALALRGIAMAQLGEHARARELLRRAARAFGPQEELARARCRLADAEVALALRDLADPSRSLLPAADLLAAHGDPANAVHARLLAARQFLLLGRLDQAEATLEAVSTTPLPARAAAVAALASAELALRRLRVAPARAALDRAQQAARAAGIPALLAEVEEARALVDRPAARLVAAGASRELPLAGIEAVFASGALVLDACGRGLVRHGDRRSMARRPILFTLARALAEAWPGDVERDALIRTAFRMRHPDETHRARLRVEIGRLRALVKGLAAIEATPRGFVLRPCDEAEVAVLAPPIDGEQASLLALLADGAAWSTSALALALDASQRTVQRQLAELEAGGQVRGVGQARSRRWVAAPRVDFTTVLLLPASLPGA